MRVMNARMIAKAVPVQVYLRDGDKNYRRFMARNLKKGARQAAKEIILFEQNNYFD